MSSSKRLTAFSHPCYHPARQGKGVMSDDFSCLFVFLGGIAMSKYTKEDIIRMVREGDVEFIRMQFTDIFGQLKNVAITAS